MQFELSDEIINQIIFSMEDQNSRYVFDSESNGLVVAHGKEQTASDRYYSLPAWDSVNGFKIMERFVSSLHSPPVKEKLRAVLSAGKGVFRSFKDVLKEYPEIESRWFTFKEQALKREILGWYNMLRDSWGLEKIGLEPEETDELICTDFIFREESTSVESFMQSARTAAAAEIKTLYGGEFAEVLLRLEKSIRILAGTEAGYVLTAKTAETDLAGVIRAALFPENAQKTVLITDFYVFPTWRGLGVGKSLFSRCIDMLRNKGIIRIFVLSVHIPVFFERFMLRSGFRRFPAGFVAETDTSEFDDSSKLFN